MAIEALESVMGQAIAAQRAGRLGEAQTLYRRVLKTYGEHPVASHNLAVLLAQSGAVHESVALFASAWKAKRSEAIFGLSYARALLLGDRAAQALAVLREVQEGGFEGESLESLLRLAEESAGRSATAPMLDEQATALMELGRRDEAIALYRRAIEVDPRYAEAHFHLGSVLSEHGQIDEGFRHYMTRAQLVHGGGSARGRLESSEEAPHKSKHDQWQREYLHSVGITVAHDAFHAASGDRVAGAAVNPREEVAEWSREWASSSVKVRVIDDFLTPPALTALRHFCAVSTVWRRVYAAGYLGAAPEDGFACPLLAQIVEETRAVYAPLLAEHPFRYLGGFKYDSELSTGTNTHADFSAINVNLYIAPEEANLDPQSGGMRIWGRRAADEPEMRRYNGDEAALRRMLAESRAPEIVVPHQANRAVIFDSGLYHRTDQFSFRDGYLNMRINVSLLFGDFRPSDSV